MTTRKIARAMDCTYYTSGESTLKIAMTGQIMDEIRMLGRFQPQEAPLQSSVNFDLKNNDENIEFLVESVDKVQKNIKTFAQNLVGINSSLKIIKKVITDKFLIFLKFTIFFFVFSEVANFENVQSSI